MSTEPFLSPRLTGARFEGHAIPLEFLKDLAVLEEMIVEVAKGKYLEDNPNRKRSPKGFTEGIELKLTGIEEGSAIPIIKLVVAATGLLLPPRNQEYFERARDSIVNAIDAAEQNRSITDHLHEKSLSYFDRMGRSLRVDEAIEFATPARTSPAKLTKETRRKLVLASSKVKELTEETEVRGFVSEADQDKMTFEAQLLDGRKIKAPIAEQHLDTILEAFIGYKTGVRVLLQGVGRFNRTERLLGFDSIEHVSILDALDIAARLDELRLLKDGWMEGEGKAPSHEGMDWLSQTFDQHYSEDLPLPFLYPTVEGGIQAEWSIGVFEVSLEIGLENKIACWHALNMETDAEESKELNLTLNEDWKWIISQIQNLSGGAA